MDKSTDPVPLNELTQFQALRAHYSDIQPLKMTDLFAKDAGRFSLFSLNAAGLYLSGLLSRY